MTDDRTKDEGDKDDVIGVAQDRNKGGHEVDEKRQADEKHPESTKDLPGDGGVPREITDSAAR